MKSLLAAPAVGSHPFSSSLFVHLPQSFQLGTGDLSEELVLLILTRAERRGGQVLYALYQLCIRALEAKGDLFLVEQLSRILS